MQVKQMLSIVSLFVCAGTAHAQESASPQRPYQGIPESHATKQQQIAANPLVGAMQQQHAPVHIQAPPQKQPSGVQPQPGTANSKNRLYETSLDKPSKKELPDFSDETPSVVLPEITTSVRFSNSDLNRISCPVGIREALTSTEKGVSIKIQGRDAFVKFKVTKRSDGQVGYVTTPAEIFVVCGENTYTLIAFPQRIPSQLIKLSSGTEKRIKENQSIYAGMPFEKKILRVIKEVYTEDMAESYTIAKIDKAVGNFRDVRVIHRRTVDVEGEGIAVKEYEVSLKGNKSEFKLSEKHFLKADFAQNPVAVSIDKPNIRRGDLARVFVVEHRAEQAIGIRPAMSGGLPGFADNTEEDKSEKDNAATPPQRVGTPKQQIQGGARR